MLCHFRFHRTGLSNNVAGLDFKALRFHRAKTKTNICFVVYCVLIWQRDETQAETWKKSKAAAEVNKKVHCL